MNKKTMSLIAIVIFISGIYFFTEGEVVDFVDDINSTKIIHINLNGNKVERTVKSEFVERVVKSLKEKDYFDPSKIDIDMEDFKNIADDKLFKVRKIIPYSKEKPPMSDEEENNSTLYGVDVNGNGVRDDLEILAIDQFGYDKDLVESVFAGIRTYDYDMYVVENNLLEDGDVMKEVINNIDRSYNCQSYFYGKSGFYDQSVQAMDGYANNGERQDNVKYIARRLSGVADDFVTNEKNCKKFFERTKEYNYR